ncbi:putative membrane protein YvbJ [Sporomusaceae bacterium BoRhaA]|uniref:zinc-ribbon domain-containing protein n=1 Tax=Pelorhabdus rhamnosifermentans TaxID=2772457 RepID=UPI001C060149|nr:zinc-ribbon domain-containing protein [Pelorhabdus rhamnosifermentans]MBU2701412.1 putative membrane protein YvbJ [Pelorhabdus rhamnosifermentans]
MRYCVFCGVEIPNDAKFCQICGKEQPEDANLALSGYESEDKEQGANGFLSSRKKMIFACVGVFMALIAVVTTVIIFVLKR